MEKFMTWMETHMMLLPQNLAITNISKLSALDLLQLWQLPLLVPSLH